MLKHVILSTCVVSIAFSITLSRATAQDYRVEPIAEPPAADAVPSELAEQFASSGYKIIRGSSRTVCEIWPCKQWEVAADFKPTPTRLYPFSPGQLVGLLHFPRRGYDFRDQQISSGWYTLRFALQPVDGNHVGTSPTQDFLLMVPAQEENVTEPMKLEQLIQKSAEAAGSSHPAMLCLQRPDKESGESASLHHNEEQDWWKLSFSGTGVADGKTQSLPVVLIVAGHAAE